jgi:hypothetical protein
MKSISCAGGHLGFLINIQKVFVEDNPRIMFFVGFLFIVGFFLVFFFGVTMQNTLRHNVETLQETNNFLWVFQKNIEIGIASNYLLLY